jgi:hypothetical protein
MIAEAAIGQGRLVIGLERQRLVIGRDGPRIVALLARGVAAVPLGFGAVAPAGIVPAFERAAGLNHQQQQGRHDDDAHRPARRERKMPHVSSPQMQPLIFPSATLPNVSLRLNLGVSTLRHRPWPG